MIAKYGKDLTVFGTLIGIIASVLGGYNYLDNRHAQAEAVMQMELELEKKMLIKEYEMRAELLDMDIDKDSELVNYYRNRSANAESDRKQALNSAEVSRYQYLQTELDRKIRKKEFVEQKLADLETD